MSKKDITLEPEAVSIHHTIVCEGGHGEDLLARLLRVTRHQAVIEVMTPGAVLRVSEALPVFKIMAGERVLYSGRAILTNVIEQGANLICELRLDDSWYDFDPAAAKDSSLQPQFNRFLQASQGARIPDRLKIAVADMQLLLQDIRRWTEQVEIAVLAEPSRNRFDLERELIGKLSVSVMPILGEVFSRLEECCGSLDPSRAPEHAFYIRRQLHPLVLCAPFMYRTFRKPLGYAGDYEMVAMMLRDPMEGGSMFAKLLNTFFLATPPVVAHQNRITYLIEMLRTELASAWSNHKRAKVFNIGCGPAREVQQLITSSEVSNWADFMLLDFNEETLQYTQKVLSDLIQKSGRSTIINLVRKSVAQLLKEASRPANPTSSGNYDIVYCAGLFDYIPQNVCQQLTSLFYRMIRPGGLMVVTNVAACNPSRQWMELAVDWHLIYRDAAQMADLIPAAADRDEARILSDDSGVNSFLELRKPLNG